MTSSDLSDGVHGFTAPGFERLHEAFLAAAALDRRGGSALSIFHDGELVVELVTGSGSDDATPREPSTTQTCFSCTKGVVAVALLLLIERGELDLEAPVARYWPEFGEAGKSDVLVRHIASHMAGQPAFRAPVSIEDLADDRFTESVVASDAPWWPTGTALSYHAITYGALNGGLIRRITGESVGSFVQRELSTPLGLDLWIGLPEANEADVAPLHAVPEAEQALPSDNPADQAKFNNPPVLVGAGTPAWNTRRYHAGEIPGAGGVTNATSLARLYSCLALGGQPLLRPDTVELGRTELALGPDILGDWVSRFGVGFSLPTETDGDYWDPLGFGHDGYGGQTAGAWPSDRASFTYFTTALRSGPVGDERMAGVLTALRASLDALPAR